MDRSTRTELPRAFFIAAVRCLPAERSTAPDAGHFFTRLASEMYWPSRRDSLGGELATLAGAALAGAALADAADGAADAVALPAMSATAAPPPAIHVAVRFTELALLGPGLGGDARHERARPGRVG
jgi:hypothetical protein